MAEWPLIVSGQEEEDNSQRDRVYTVNNLKSFQAKFFEFSSPHIIRAFIKTNSDRTASDTFC